MKKTKLLLKGNCKCETCKISRALCRLQKKYNMSEKDMASIEALWNMAERDSTELGMLKFNLRELIGDNKP